MKGDRLAWDEPAPSDLYGDCKMVTLPSGRQCPAVVAAAMFPRKRPTLTERFVARLESEHGIVLPPDWEFHRVHAGYYQRAQGAWSWWIDGSDKQGVRQELVASHLSLTELMRAKAWQTPTRSVNSSGALEVDPA